MESWRAFVEHKTPWKNHLASILRYSILSYSDLNNLEFSGPHLVSSSCLKRLTDRLKKLFSAAMILL